MNQALAVGPEAKRRVRIAALWKLFAQNSSSFQKAGIVRFYEVALLTIWSDKRKIPRPKTFV